MINDFIDGLGFGDDGDDLTPPPHLGRKREEEEEEAISARWPRPAKYIHTCYGYAFFDINLVGGIITWQKKANTLPARHSFLLTRKIYVRGLLIGFLVSVITTVFSALGFLRGWENSFLDFLIWWKQETRSAQIILIEIDDQDYQTIFHATSPLPRRELGVLLSNLAASKPKMIGLDLDLSTPTPEDTQLRQAFEQIHNLNVPV